MNKQKEQQKHAPQTSKTLRFFAGLSKLFRSKTGLWCSLLVLIVLAGLLVARSARQGDDPRFDLPEELSVLIDDAVEVCSDDDPWKAGCVEAVWAACEEAYRFWQDYIERTAVPEGEGHLDFWRQYGARSVPYRLFCRLAHIAELGRLAAVLADRYSDEFYVEEVITDWSVKFGDFWRFREHITYTPWEPVTLYGGRTPDATAPGVTSPDSLGPILYRRGETYTVGRWLEKIQNWGHDLPSKFDMLSDKSVDATNSLLGKIVDLTKPYDSWPIDATSDPRTGKTRRVALNTPVWNNNVFLPTYYHPAGASEAARGVYEICHAAITDTKIRASGWEDRIDECHRASTPCAQSSDDADTLCSIMPILAEKEQSWQELPSVCETAELGNSRFSILHDECWQAINRICNIILYSIRTEEINYRRNLSINHTACLITNPNKALSPL